MASRTKKAAPSEEELANMTVEELNEYADEFDWEDAEEITPMAPRPLDATITVRFNSDELDGLRRRAEAAGMKVTTFIRAVTLQHAADRVTDMEAVQRAVAVLVEQLYVPNSAHLLGLSGWRMHHEHQEVAGLQVLPPGAWKVVDPITCSIATFATQREAADFAIWRAASEDAPQPST